MCRPQVTGMCGYNVTLWWTIRTADSAKSLPLRFNAMTTAVHPLMVDLLILLVMLLVVVLVMLLLLRLFPGLGVVGRKSVGLLAVSLFDVVVL